MPKAVIKPEPDATGASYPPPHDEPCKGRRTWTLTRQFDLTQFGINRVELPPGGWSTQRHWHKANDEAVIVISGELVMVTDDGEEVLRAGDCAGFKAGVANAHHFQNRSTEMAVYYDIGGREMPDVSTFPDAGFVAKPRFQLQFKPIGE